LHPAIVSGLFNDHSFMTIDGENAHTRSASGAVQVARQILGEIIAGDLKAGVRLYTKDLVMRTGVGSTPLREGLSRLMASGLVEAIDQHGFQVVRMDRADVEDFTAFRLLLEEEALRQSIVRGKWQWEAAVTSALADMAGFAPSPRKRPRDALSRYSGLHKKLHVALISACASPRLKANLDLLFNLEIFYCHNLVAAAGPLADLKQLHDQNEHRALAETVLARNADAACRMLADHQWRLGETLRSRLSP
jgi:DNA-binding GntR family transcriptional regulator